MAQSDRGPSAERGDLLRLPLLSRNARGESGHGAGHCLFDTDSYFDAAQFGCDWLDRTKLFGFPRSCAGGDFSAGATTWIGCSWRTSNFFADQRKAGDCP